MCLRTVWDDNLRFLRLRKIPTKDTSVLFHSICLASVVMLLTCLISIVSRTYLHITHIQIVYVDTCNAMRVENGEPWRTAVPSAMFSCYRGNHFRKNKPDRAAPGMAVIIAAVYE